MTYWTMVQCADMLEEEVVDHYYRYGKGHPPSPAKMLRRYGFKINGKKKLLKAVRNYLQEVDVVKLGG